MKLNPKYKARDRRKPSISRYCEPEWDIVDHAVRRDVRQSGGFLPRQRGYYKRRLRRGEAIDYLTVDDYEYETFEIRIGLVIDQILQEGESEQLAYEKAHDTALVNRLMEAAADEAQAAIDREAELAEAMNPFPWLEDGIKDVYEDSGSEHLLHGLRTGRAYPEG